MFEITKCLEKHEKLSKQQQFLQGELKNLSAKNENEEADRLIDEINILDSKMQQLESRTFKCDIFELRQSVINTMQTKCYFDEMPKTEYDYAEQDYKTMMANHEIRRMFIFDDEFCKRQMENFGDCGEIELRIDLILNSSIILEAVNLMERVIAEREKYHKDNFDADIQ